VSVVIVMAPWKVRCLRAYIAAHLHATIRTVDLAKVVQVGPFRLKRMFKENFGCTPHQYVIRMRVERAQKLLAMSGDSLAQIATECGFTGQSHLSHLFYKIVGERPGAWRRATHRGREATSSRLLSFRPAAAAGACTLRAIAVGRLNLE
jgi:transcriptional regulator GlxA family with amidase domain